MFTPYCKFVPQVHSFPPPLPSPPHNTANEANLLLETPMLHDTILCHLSLRLSFFLQLSCSRSQPPYRKIENYCICTQVGYITLKDIWLVNV